MIRAFMLGAAVLATVLSGGCTNEPSTATSVDTPTAAVPSSPGLASVTYTGLPYGPAGLWTMNKLNFGPYPFTGSQNYINADTLILQVNAARNKGQRLVLAMTGGLSTGYTTNGQFDMTKWKNTMNTYKTTAIKNAVAAGVSDGTIIGNILVDEPETKRWGTVLTKAIVDQMAAYVKAIFPTLPVGVNVGPPGYKWRSTERYKVLDFARYQYNWYITSGNVVAWRDAVLAQAKLDGLTPALSINVLDGGVKDPLGSWLCVDAGQAGTGTYFPNCRMTPDQVKTWGKALAPYGCFFMMWRYDQTYMSKTANQDAFKAIAALVATKPRRSCKRVV